MGRPENQKNLAGDIPEDLFDEIMTWISDHKDLKVRQLVQAMAEAWLEIPEAVQAMFLISRRGSTTWTWLGDEVRDRLVTAEDVFELREKAAPRVVRRLLLLLRDYALTREGVRSYEDLATVLDSFHDIVQWLDPKFLRDAPGRDRFAAEQVRSILDQRAGIDAISQPQPQARDYMTAIRNIASTLDPGQYRLLSPEEQRLVDAIRRDLGPSDEEIARQTADVAQSREPGRARKRGDTASKAG